MAVKTDKEAKGIGQSVDYSKQVVIPDRHKKAGSLVGKVPIVMDGGRTVIYVAPGTDEEYIRGKYSR